MRELKYAILGLVNRKPYTGYDISREFGDLVMSNFWHARHSQIYPELQRLTEEGCVEFDVTVQGQKMEKKCYHITDKGHREFMEWLNTDEELGFTPKDVFRLRSYFADGLERAEYVQLLKSQLEKHSAKEKYLSDSMQSSFQERPAVGTAQLGDYMVLEGAIMRERTYMEWLEKCLSYYL
ncbi:MAG: PadR family transcriptional regulator [Butyrivibrio sp.]|jgi:DNA-binding PadR family transcriptional regulator|nr:PadR family transcriptional regulator [Butyrivibrio sp.]